MVLFDESTVAYCAVFFLVDTFCTVLFLMYARLAEIIKQQTDKSPRFNILISYVHPHIHIHNHTSISASQLSTISKEREGNRRNQKERNNNKRREAKRKDRRGLTRRAGMILLCNGSKMM